VALDTTWLVALDAISALLTLGVAAFFFRIYATTRISLHLLFALGLVLIGATFATTTASHFDLGGDPDIYDHLRIAGQLGGAFVVLFAYVGARTKGSRSPWIAVGLAAVALSVFFNVVYFVLPPALTFPGRQQDFAIAHAVMAVTWATSAWLAGRGSFSLARSGAGFVPAAFALFAMSKYTWFIVEAGSASDAMVLLVYPWRFTAIAFLIAAVTLAPRMPQEAEHAAS
jgi:hypothetical protein